MCMHVWVTAFDLCMPVSWCAGLCVDVSLYICLCGWAVIGCHLCKFHKSSILFMHQSRPRGRDMAYRSSPSLSDVYRFLKTINSCGSGGRCPCLQDHVYVCMSMNRATAGLTPVAKAEQSLPSAGLLSQSLEFSSPADNYTVCEGDNATLRYVPVQGLCESPRDIMCIWNQL